MLMECPQIRLSQLFWRKSYCLCSHLILPGNRESQINLINTPSRRKRLDAQNPGLDQTEIYFSMLYEGKSDWCPKIRSFLNFSDLNQALLREIGGMPKNTGEIKKTALSDMPCFGNKTSLRLSRRKPWENRHSFSFGRKLGEALQRGLLPRLSGCQISCEGLLYVIGLKSTNR